MTASEFIAYYGSLIIIQYANKPKAVATVETTVTGVIMPQGSGSTIDLLPTLPLAVQDAYNLNPTVQTLHFSAVPASGSFTVSYQGNTSAGIPYNDTLAQMQLTLSGFFGTGQITLTGGLSNQGLQIAFNIQTVPSLVTATSALLDGSGSPVVITVTTNQAQGVQLDVIGKYVGVTRSGFGPTGPITLGDSDFLQLIAMAIISNNNPSDLATIVGFLNRFFPNVIQVIDESDTAPMQMTYLIASNALNQNLIDLFVSEGLLPIPMAVGTSIIVVPDITSVYGWCDYATATPTSPNTYHTVGMNCGHSYTTGDYNTTWTYVVYGDRI